MYFLCVKETNVLYENIVQIYEHIHAFRSTDENRKNIMFVNSFLKEMTASYVNDQECMFAQSNETDEIFPEIPIFLNENKWDLHIAPIYNNGIILFTLCINVLNAKKKILILSQSNIPLCLISLRL